MFGDLFAGKEILRMLRKEPTDHVQGRFIESLGKLGDRICRRIGPGKELVDGILAQAGPGTLQIFLLGGEPLMCHILRTLAGIGEIDEVYAYCSDERICEYLPQGVRFLRRSPGLDRDTTLGREIYDSFTADVEADLYVLAHATSPFIRAETVADALRHVRSGEYDSAFSAEKIQTFAWFEGRPLNYALDDIPRTQTIEPVYIETSAFFIFPRTLWCGRGRRIGEKPYMAVVDRIEGLDIDNPEDFTMAEIIAASRRLG